MFKKSLSILLIFMLVLMTIGPIPMAEAISINGNPVTSAGKGSVVVSGAAPGATLTLTAKEGGSSGSGTASSGGTYTFDNLEPGIYTVTESANGATVVSNETRVLPEPVTVTEPDNQGQITVSGAYPGAELTIHHDRTGFIPRKTDANSSGIGYYRVGYSSEQVPPGNNYRVRQTINGVTSTDSNSIDINPRAVRLTVTIEGAGPNNNAGAIEVQDTRRGNRLLLYKVDSGQEPTIRVVEDADTYTFTGLSAGKYYVIQEENGAQSIRSNEVSIIDEMPPTIELIGPSEVFESMPKNYENWEYKVSASDVKATDNISTPKIDISVSPNRTMNTPGVYKVTYTAIDDAGNESSVTKTVTIAPPTLDIAQVFNTFKSGEEPPGRNTGDVKVDNVMANATLKVYQDPDGKSIKTIVRANDSSQGTFDISDIIVGKDYYVTQIVNGIESATSTRFEIKDDTKPIITLKNSSTVEFVRGGLYIEYGAEAIDNVDNANEITAKIRIDSSNVNMDVPGKYYVTYNVTDNAGNVADEVIRTVVVKPHAVVAIGSDADIGEVGVKDAFPGAILKLYNVNDTNNPVAVSKPLAANATTYVFKNATDRNGNIINPDKGIPPGSYFVVQEFSIEGGEMLESMRSNIVDVRDTDRPYITIKGSENMFFTWDKPDMEYEFNGTHGTFVDPGAFAEDYLDNDNELTNNIKRKIFYNSKEICNDSDDTLPNCDQRVKIEFPGVYEIAYNVTANRGTKADEKRRTITIAPPAIEKIEAKAGKSRIEVEGTFFHEDIVTMVNLYNKYGELIKSQRSKASGDSVFKDIPAGLGYYVTQTVNGVSSTPSDPVNLTLFEDADETALMTSFELVYASNKRATGTIDHASGNIEVVVPKDTNVTNLTAVFQANGKVTVNFTEQTSGTTKQNFTNAVKYTVTPEKGEAKTYTVTVVKQSFETETWTNTITKRTSFTTTSSTTTLTPAEMNEAANKGVSFVGDDRAIHVPAANVKETTRPAITVKKDAFTARTTDPAWAKTVQFATEIRFGSGELMRPIEFEVTSSSNKQLAKLVREDNQLYAIIQPTQKQGKNLIGLVTSPGTYAFIDGIQAPTIQETGNNSYRLSGGANGQIFYTTSSKTVDFERSVRNTELKSYMHTDFESTLNDWQLYRAGQTIKTNKSLYAYVLKDSIVSPINEVVKTSERQWQAPITRPISHSFTISFNAPVDKKAIYSDLIYVVDDYTGEQVPVSLQLSNDRKQIIVSPKKAYKRGNQYTLVIEQQLKGYTKNNEFLQQAITQTFITK